jgi:hypothetical protein
MLQGFDLAFLGMVGNNSDPRRFSTATRSEFILAEFFSIDADICAQLCQLRSTCRGIFFWRTSADVLRCNLLTDLGAVMRCSCRPGYRGRGRMAQGAGLTFPLLSRLHGRFHHHNGFLQLSAPVLFHVQQHQHATFPGERASHCTL